MRILHLLASPALSGPAENVVALALEQRALGHQVSVAIDSTRAPSSEEPAAPRLEALGLRSQTGLRLCTKDAPWKMAADLWRLRRLEVDVLHAHFSHDHLLARLAHRANVQVVRSIHAPRALRWSLPRADGFTVPTRRFAAQLPNLPVRTFPAMVGSGFDGPFDRALARAALGLGTGRVYGMGSALQERRRHAVGLRAFALLAKDDPEARLELAGDGVERPALERLAGELEIASRVNFRGYLHGPAYAQWLGALDQLWVLGLGNDFSARTAAQAWARKVPVLAVAEGALEDEADLVVAPDAAEVALGARALVPRVRQRPSNQQICATVMELYQP